MNTEELRKTATANAVELKKFLRQKLTVNDYYKACIHIDNLELLQYNNTDGKELGL